MKGGNMHEINTSKSSLKLICNLTAIAKAKYEFLNATETVFTFDELYFAGACSFSSNTEFEYDGTVSQFSENKLPSNTTGITFKNPTGVTLTGKLKVLNELYMLDEKSKTLTKNLTLSNSNATALASNSGYSIGFLSKAISDIMGNLLFEYGNSTLGDDVSINMSEGE